jgi:hypothetical protein
MNAFMEAEDLDQQGVSTLEASLWPEDRILTAGFLGTLGLRLRGHHLDHFHPQDILHVTRVPYSRLKRSRGPSLPFSTSSSFRRLLAAKLRGGSERTIQWACSRHFGRLTPGLHSELVF